MWCDVREKDGVEEWEEENAPCCVEAPPQRKMAREKMRAHVTPRVIEETHFILPYHPEQVQVQDNSVAVISPRDPLKENNQLIKKYHVWFEEIWRPTHDKPLIAAGDPFWWLVWWHAARKIWTNAMYEINKKWGCLRLLHLTTNNYREHL